MCCIQTHAEFDELYLTYHESPGNRSAEKPFNPSQYASSVPYSIDWRTKGAVGSVKNQVAIATALKYFIVLCL